MKVRVTIIETKQNFRTYEINGVNSLDAAKKCAKRAYDHEFQPNAYLFRQVPRAPFIEIGAMEVVEP
jgi:hypothetical protein